MNWDDFSGFTFCESSPGGARMPWWLPAELANCLSSFALIYVGCKGGTVGRAHYGDDPKVRSPEKTAAADLARLLYGALAACGIGSALFHAKFIYAFRFLDEFSMAYFVTLGCYANLCRPGRRNFLRPFMAAVSLVLFFILLLEIAIFARPSVFRALFVVPVLGMGATIVSDFPTSTALQRDLATTSLVSALIASVAWVVDELLCDYVRYVYLHAWWHVFMAVAANHFVELTWLKTRFAGLNRQQADRVHVVHQSRSQSGARWALRKASLGRRDFRMRFCTFLSEKLPCTV